MKKEFQLLLIFFVIFQCNSIFAKKSPDWVKNRPIDSEYYIGIGFAQKIKGNNEHIEIAKTNALKNLSSEITVNISGEAISNIVEKAGMVEDEFKTQIRSTTQAELDGYELVDTWQDKNEYWIYYQLSKELYKQLKQQKIDKAVSLTLDLYSEAKINEEKKNIEKALLYYLQSLNPIEKYIGESLETAFRGSTIYLNNEIYFSIQNLLSNINLTPQNPTLEAKKNKPIKQFLQVAAFYNNEDGIQTPISNLPLHFFFLSGSGDLLQDIRTDENGIGKSKVSRVISSEKMQIIQTQLDISRFINQDSTSFIFQNILKSFPVPTTKIILNVSGLTFYIQSNETNLGKILTVLHIESEFKNQLSEKGYTFAEDKSGADIYITINANSREGSEMFGMYTSFVDLSFSAIDMISEEEIYKSSINNISGQGLSYEKAGLKAFQNTAKKSCEDMIPELIEILKN